MYWIDEISKVLATDAWLENLRAIIATARRQANNDSSIVQTLYGLFLNTSDKEHKTALLEIMSEISPHLKQTQAQPTPELQAQFELAIRDTPGTPLAFLRKLKHSIDNAGLIVELELFREKARQISEAAEDEVLDAMDCVVEWGCSL